jgi:hypothetical protein
MWAQTPDRAFRGSAKGRVKEESNRKIPSFGTLSEGRTMERPGASVIQ